MKILLNCSLPPAALKQMFQSVNLSRVRKIDSWYVDRSDVEPMTEMMPFITTPCWTRVWGKYCAVFISELTESLIERTLTTGKLKHLKLDDINVTSSPAVEFITSLQNKDHSWCDSTYNGKIFWVQE